MSIQGNSVKTLCYLELIAGWANEVPGPSEVAIAIGLKRQAVSRAYGELIKANFVIKRNGNYQLNPLFCWKGNDEQYEEAVRALGVGQRPRQLVEALP